ncbi:MAG: STAS domain-containing protein [Planctomycetota bacterium]|jgi:anti-anti-sigma factor
MDITVKESGDVKIVVFEGNLDTNTAPAAEDEINGLIDGGTLKLLVNFEKLDYISSAGLRVLLATAKKLKPSSGDLKICCLNATVQEVFDISGFASILSVSSTEEEALGSF